MTVTGWEGWADRWSESPTTSVTGPVIDAHSHLKVPGAAELAMEHFSPELDPRSLYSTDQTNALNRAYHDCVHDRFTEPAARLEDMEIMGVDAQAIALAPPQYFYWLNRAEATRISSMQNDAIAEIAAANPQQFWGVGTLPMAHPAEAVKEAYRLRNELDIRAIEIGTDVVGVDLDDPKFEPVWEALAELGTVVTLHPAGFTEARRLSDYYLVNVIGLPLSSTLAVTRLILGGVFERHPLLRMLVVHGGGYLPFYSARTDHAFRHRPEMREHIDRLPSEYLSNLWFDSTVFSPVLLKQLVEQYGDDRVLLGTDYPFDMGQGNPVDFIASAGLTDDQRAKVLGRNAEELFGLKAIRQD